MVPFYSTNATSGVGNINRLWTVRSQSTGTICTSVCTSVRNLLVMELQQHDSGYAFPRYCDGKICNANSASAALNKWLKQTIGNGYVMHSFRHSMRDRLRAVNCPTEMIDQIGGWSKRSVGEGYGGGYEVSQLHAHLRDIV